MTSAADMCGLAGNPSQKAACAPNSSSRHGVIHSLIVERSIVASGRPYLELIAAFEEEMGHLDLVKANLLVTSEAPWGEVEDEIGNMARPHGLMIIAQAEQGRITSLSGLQKQSSLYLVGNPVIAESIIRVDMHASLLVPFRVALYDDGGDKDAFIAYDRPSSFLGVLNRPELGPIAADLDKKIDAVVKAIIKH